MLRLMRKHATNWLIKFILFAIVIVFIFWGVGSFRSQRAARVATVNGHTITLEEYQRAYNDLLYQYQQQFGNQLNPETLKMLRIDQVAMDRLIDQRLILEEAERLNFEVTDKELTQSILEVPAFQSAGAFDNSRYRQVLQNLRMTPEEFETAQRDSMLMEALRKLVTQNVAVADDEALAWFQWENAETDIEYILLGPQEYKDVEVSEEEIKLYFDQNAEKFTTDPAIKVQYLHFAPEAYASEVEVTEEEIKAYYDLHPEEFHSPESVEARHILLKVAPNADEAADAQVQARAQEIYEQAKDGKDFAELAKTFSEGPSKEEGGYVGTFTREEMVKPFADQAFSMKAGEISEPLRTQFGWHIIKVEQVNPERMLPLEETRTKISSQIATEKQKARAYEAAEKVYDATFEHDVLEKAAAASGMTAVTTDFFTRRNPPRQIKDSQAFAQKAFALSANQFSDILELPSGYYLLQVVEKKPARIPDLADVRELVREDVLAEKRDERARQAAEALLADLKDEKVIQREFKSTGFFKRNEPIPQIGYENAVSTAAFELSAEKPLPETVLKGRKGYYIIRFKDRQTPPAEDFNPQKDQVKEMLLAQKQRQVFSAWLENLRGRSEININQELLNRGDV